jgi:hypothetical protein
MTAINIDDGASSTHGRNASRKAWREETAWEILGVDGIILKWILRK